MKSSTNAQIVTASTNRRPSMNSRAESGHDLVIAVGDVRITETDQHHHSPQKDDCHTAEGDTELDDGPPTQADVEVVRPEATEEEGQARRSHSRLRVISGRHRRVSRHAGGHCTVLAVPAMLAVLAGVLLLRSVQRRQNTSWCRTPVDHAKRNCSQPSPSLDVVNSCSTSPTLCEAVSEGRSPQPPARGRTTAHR